MQTPQQQITTTKTDLPINVLLFCDYCGKEFRRKRWQFIKSNEKFGNKSYCSRKCSADNRVKRYETHLYCNNCVSDKKHFHWVPIADAVIKVIKGIEYRHCPHCKGKLRINSKKSKLNHKRKIIKRL